MVSKRSCLGEGVGCGLAAAGTLDAKTNELLANFSASGFWCENFWTSLCLFIDKNLCAVQSDT